MQGGGWCFDESTCASRPYYLTGSGSWPSTKTFSGGLMAAQV
jgi:hypothetical protein